MSLTLYDQVEKNTLRYPNKPAISILEKKKIRNITYQKMHREINDIAKAMVKSGVKKGDNVVILSENRAEWYTCFYAICLIGATAVPLYVTASDEQQHYILNDSGAVFGFVSKAMLYEKIAPIAEQQFIKTVFFDENEKKDREFSNICYLDAFITDAAIEKDVGKNMLPDENDIAVLIYTSGTTGEPKGVMLTHKNVISNVSRLMVVIKDMKQMRYLSLLPLSHAYEFTVIQVVMAAGGTIIPVPVMAKAVDYIQKMEPTISCAVPRLFEKIYHTVLGNVNNAGPIVKKLFHSGLKLGEKIYPYLEKNEPIPFPYNVRYAFYQKLVFDKIRKKTVKSIDLFISGGAAIMPEIVRFFNIIGTTIVEGYGISECSPVVSCNLPDNRDVGTVGVPLEDLDVQITKNGEVKVKGPIVMKGYYKKEKETAEVISKDGYFYTGDLAIWTDNRKLKIIGRIKDIIVMASGKNIAPQKIENMLMSDPFIEAVCVVGDEEKYLAALIVPEFENLKKYADEHEFHYRDLRDLVRHPIVKRLIQKKIDAVNARIEKYEIIKKFHIVDKKFSIETGELTPTLKLKRAEIKKRYKKVLDRLYTV